MIEDLLTFRLRPEADADAFLAADRAVQTGFAYRQPGLLRRTTARSADGHWIVISLWASGDEADRAARRWGSDPLASTFSSFVDPGSTASERYTTLD